jgi:hypothetical protein
LVEALAQAICAHEGSALRCHPLDTTSVALTGEDVPDRDEHAIRLTHGSSKAHRPDLKPAVLELRVSPDGGVPVVRKRGDGHTSAPQVFQARAEAWMSAFQDTPSPRYLVAEAKGYGEDKAAHLAQLGVITRLPATRTVVSQVRRQALPQDTWEPCDDATPDHPLALCHEGMAPRGVVVSSRAARERAEATLNNAPPRAYGAITTPLWHLQAQRCGAPATAQEALAVLAMRWQHHRVESSQLTQSQRYAGTGRPTPRTPLKALAWQLQAQVPADDDTMAQDTPAKACAVLGTHIAARA